MLRRSRAVGGKQGLMTENITCAVIAAGQHNRLASPSIFLSPERLFGGFSPTAAFFSGADARSFPSSFIFSPASRISRSMALEKKAPWEEAVGLGIVEKLNRSFSRRSESNMRVISGLQLRIQILNSLDSPPIEFGIKNKDVQLALLTPTPASKRDQTFAAMNRLSPSEMELSEDYTCVISHGPNPKTTHIFDDLIIVEVPGEKEGGGKFLSLGIAMSPCTGSFHSVNG